MGSGYGCIGLYEMLGGLISKEAPGIHIDVDLGLPHLDQKCFPGCSATKALKCIFQEQLRQRRERERQRPCGRCPDGCAV